MAVQYPKVDYKSMGKSVRADLVSGYQSPGKNFGPDITPSPYEVELAQYLDNPSTFGDKYAGNNTALASRAMALGTQDYSGDIYRLQEKGIAEAQKRQRAGFAALGTPELANREDVAGYWSEQRTDAATRAKIEGENLRRQGLAAAVQAIQTMGAADLDRAMSKARVLLAANEQWQGYQRLLSPLMEAAGEQGAGTTTRGPVGANVQNYKPGSPVGGG